jgi:hypothetical protein
MTISTELDGGGPCRHQAAGNQGFRQAPPSTSLGSEEEAPQAGRQPRLLRLHDAFPRQRRSRGPLGPPRPKSGPDAKRRHQHPAAPHAAAYHRAPSAPPTRLLRVAEEPSPMSCCRQAPPPSRARPAPPRPGGGKGAHRRRRRAGFARRRPPAAARGGGRGEGAAPAAARVSPRVARGRDGTNRPFLKEIPW